MTTSKPTHDTVGEEIEPGTANGPSEIRKLNPVDGLFLKGEHLAGMQDYAHDLALLAGVSGPGVHYGYDLTLNYENKTIAVSPGLATDSAHTPLRLRTSVTIHFGKLPADGDGLWIIEVAEGPVHAAGEEAVYGTLCDDPCGGARIQPWLDGSVVVRLRQEKQTAFQSTSDNKKRSEMASEHFESERRQLNPWLRPYSKGSPVDPIRTRKWGRAEPYSEPQPEWVPIGALLRIGVHWELDTWLARRDVGEPLSRSMWEGHLGLRPWNVFIAQVLQFQDQLASGRQSASVAREDVACRNAVADMLNYMETAQKSIQSQTALEALKTGHKRGQDFLRYPDSTARWGQFVELPPAGIVPLSVPEVYNNDNGADRWKKDFSSWFGRDVEVEVHFTRADCALRALADAQHLDRIRLEGGPTPAVHIYVPKSPDDYSDGEPYRWVVFTRACFHIETVDVYVLTGIQQDEVVNRISAGESVDATLKYRDSRWEVPGPLSEINNLEAQVNSAFSTLAIAATDEEATLTWRRAKMLAALLSAGPQDNEPDVVILLDSDHKLPRPAIAILVRD